MRIRVAAVLVLASGAAACGTPPAPPKKPAPAPSASAAADAPAEPCTLREPSECKRLCGAGNGPSCTALGVLLADDGFGVPAEPARAATLFSTECERGDGSACANLGTMHLRGRGMPADRGKALGLYRKGCDIGVAEACTDWAILQLEGSPAKAVAALRGACEQKSWRACHRLGVVLQLGGAGQARDFVAAEGLLVKACEGGVGAACGDLGLLLTDKKPSQPAQAALVFERGCELGSGDACISLGGMALRGISPVSQDAALAYKLFATACDLGTPSGCFNVGLMYERKLVPIADGDSAAKRYRQACEQGHEGACGKLGAGGESP